MEAIKNAIGLGGGQVQSGQEPVSGETGSGTASEPYDGGNATGKSGLATDETTKETTANNTYSNVDTGSKGNTIADQLSSIATNTDSPKSLGQSESLSSMGSTFRQMSDTTAAKILNDLNIVFNNDSLSVQERIYQLYMLLARYDKGGDNSIPETPKPLENATNAIGGAIEHLSGTAPVLSQEHLEKQQGGDSTQVDGVVEEPTEAKTEATTEDTLADGKASGVSRNSPGSVVYNESEILHDGQNKEEEISVPVVGAEKSEASLGGVDTNAANISKTVESGAVIDGGIREEYVDSATLAADGILEKEAVYHDSGVAAAPISSGEPKTSEPAKKSKSQKIKEKLHIGKK